MANCSKCGAVTVFKSGVSKSSGKPYAGNKCTACDNFDFQRKIAPPQASASQALASQALAPQAAPVQNRLELLKLAVQLTLKSEVVTMEEIALNLEMLNSIMRGDNVVKNEGQDEVPF